MPRRTILLAVAAGSYSKRHSGTNIDEVCPNLLDKRQVSDSKNSASRRQADGRGTPHLGELCRGHAPARST